MAKSITVLPKKRGRPATGRDPLITARLPAALLEALDNWAEKNGVPRSELVRQFVEAGLASRQKAKKTK